MSEQYVRLVVEPNQTIIVNDRPFTADEIGGISLSESNLWATAESPMSVFENELAEKLTDAKQIMVLRMMGSSSLIRMNVLVGVLDGDRQLARELLDMGMRHGILQAYHNYQWKVIQRIFKERMLERVNRLQEFLVTADKPKTHEEILKSSIAQSKAVMQSIRETEEEETIHEDTDMSVKESMAMEKSTGVNKKPATQPPVKKIQVVTKGKPALSKPLGHKPKAR